MSILVSVIKDIYQRNNFIFLSGVHITMDFVDDVDLIIYFEQ